MRLSFVVGREMFQELLEFYLEETFLSSSNDLVCNNLGPNVCKIYKINYRTFIIHAFISTYCLFRIKD